MKNTKVEIQRATTEHIQDVDEPAPNLATWPVCSPCLPARQLPDHKQGACIYQNTTYKRQIQNKNVIQIQHKNCKAPILQLRLSCLPDNYKYKAQKTNTEYIYNMMQIQLQNKISKLVHWVVLFHPNHRRLRKRICYKIKSLQH